MDGQRQRPGGRRRRRKPRDEGNAPAEPVMIAARRPGSPPMQRTSGRGIFTTNPPAARGSPARGASTAGPTAGERLAPERELPSESDANGVAATAPVEPKAPTRREARIVQLVPTTTDERERLRLRLLERVMASEGRGAITRAATEYSTAGFAFPDEQAVQLQLLEHFDETTARCAIEVLARLLDDQVPAKRPILEQRLRRLEEYADEPGTRDAAAALRRTLR